MATKTPGKKGQYADFVIGVRKALTWTQEQLAEEFGKSKGNISAWENNRHNPSLAQMQRMSLLSGIPLPGTAEPQGMYDVTESPDVKRLIMAFGWLTDEQQKSILRDLESKAEANKAISRQLGPRWEFKSDQHVAAHIKPAPASKPRSKKKGTSRDLGSAFGDYETDA